MTFLSPYVFACMLFLIPLKNLSSEGSLAGHTFCDMGHPFLKMLISGPMTHASVAERLAVELSLLVSTT